MAHFDDHPERREAAAREPYRPRCVLHGCSPPAALCGCGSWDVAFFAYEDREHHRCKGCGRVWTVSDDGVFEDMREEVVVMQAEDGGPLLSYAGLLAQAGSRALARIVLDHRERRR